MQDKSDLEYQAGQEESGPEEERGVQPPREMAKQDQKPEAQQDVEADKAAEDEGEQGQESAVNEDTEENYEDRQFTAPQVSPLLGKALGGRHCCQRFPQGQPVRLKGNRRLGMMK